MNTEQNAAERLTNYQKTQLGQVVRGLARMDATARAMRVWAKSVAAFDQADPDAIEAANDALFHIVTLAETVGWLGMDVEEALQLAFPGMSWTFDEPGYPKDAA